MYYSFIVKSSFFCSFDALITFLGLVSLSFVFLDAAMKLENSRCSSFIISKISTACETRDKNAL